MMQGVDRSGAWRLKTGLGGTPEARWRGHEDVGGHSAQPEAEMPNVLPRNNLRKQARPPIREGAGSHASAPPRQHSEAEARPRGGGPTLLLPESPLATAPQGLGSIQRRHLAGVC